MKEDELEALKPAAEYMLKEMMKNRLPDVVLKEYQLKEGIRFTEEEIIIIKVGTMTALMDHLRQQLEEID